MTEDDSTLLRRYADEKSEAAFAALVSRHLDLVYAVALRQVGGDAHLAQDVAQTVFTALARKANQLTGRAVLGGWLYRTAQFTAIDVVRSESRRRAREQEASTMHDFSFNPNPDGAVDWDKLRPTLDQAIGELNDDDRDAVVLRYFEGKSFADVGVKLRLAENTARMRVERALDKLHALLARRGVTSTTAALAVALANQPAMAAPAGLAATVTGAALAGSWVTAAGTAGGGLFAFMSTGKMAVGIAALIALVGFGTAYLGSSEARGAQAALTDSKLREKDLNAKLRDLENRVTAETRRVQLAEENYAKLSSAAAKVSAAGAEDAEPISSDVVTRRFKRAQELVRSGDPAEALRELLWCYDVGMPRISGMGAVRTTSLSLFGELGNRYPPALAVLRERREKAQGVMMTGEGEFAATQEFAAINRALKEDQATLALLEQLPAGDRRRSTLASTSYDYLVENRRYGEAIEGRSYGSISSTFERVISQELPANLPNLYEARQSARTYLISSTVRNIEALAGAGDLTHARALAERLLAYDPTEGTRALIQTHAERAGQPALLAAPSSR